MLKEMQVDPHIAVVLTASGQTWITGFASYLIDPNDPFPEGHAISDFMVNVSSAQDASTYLADIETKTTASNLRHSCTDS